LAVEKDRDQARSGRGEWQEIVARMRQGDAFNFGLSIFLMLGAVPLMATRERLLGIAWLISGIAIWIVRYVIALEPEAKPAAPAKQEQIRPRKRSR